MSSELVEADLEGDVGPVTILTGVILADEANTIGYELRRALTAV